MTTEEMTLAEMKAAYEKAQAELAQERASIENLQKELESVKSNKYQSRYKLGAKPKKLIFEMTGDSEDLSDGEEPHEEKDEAIPDPVTKRLNKMENHMKKRCSLMMKLMTKLPGAPTPVETEPTDGYAASPFCEAIARVTVPHQLRLPTWTTLYDGTSDPYRHVNFYTQRMWQIGIPYDLVEPVMCKSFGRTLDGAALEWLMNITPGSIFCLSDLINAFYQQFASSRQLEKQTSDLYRLVQGPTESVRDYFNRFNCEKISIKNCDVRTAIEAFKRGLVPNSELYRELNKYPCANFEEVRSRATAQMRIEDDEITRMVSQRPAGGSSDRRSYTPRNNGWRHQPYNRQGQVQNVNQYDDTNSVYRNERVVYPPISEYGFNVDIGGVVNALQSVGGTVRWPKKSDRPDSTKDMSRGESEAVKEGQTEDEVALDKSLAAMIITFDDSDSTDIIQEHHDGLVISLPIGNALIKRILIDNGSSANVLFLEALQEMGLDEKSIIRRLTVLVGFSGESLRTVGEISLPTYAEGVNVMTKFNVVDCPSAYNVILGRPWIHKMKAVPSTYHQSIKFPTKWGVMEIKGQQRDAKKCYEMALKPSKSSI
ncbi:uncharacterized protein [Spinacia oleracea]|uniref:Retrotransposon gag domain-containing protein n=1 Tax=Spinacia oleracea TaxID=3562 RepID=A0ABM3R8C0_SPIOL|nr:uncharacterized protein LOC130467382 [Spinacia oleracea]